MLADVPVTNLLLDAALAYAARNWFVFPTHDIATGVCSCGQRCDSPGKHPRTPTGFHNATTDASQIRSWWAKWPRANIGIDCGRSGLIIADVDVKRGAQGEATMRWFLARPELPFATTAVAATPSGGYHFYFTGAQPKFKSAKFPGIDFQGAGAYVLAPPSVAFGQYDEQNQPMPGSGREYRYLNNAPIQPFPTVLQKTDDETITFGAKAWDEPERAAIPYGEHRGALLRYGWHLRSVLGLTVEAALPLMQAFLGTLEGYDPRRPFTQNDLAGMLRNLKPNIAVAPPPTQAVALDPIVSAADVIANAPPPRQIVIPGLMIRGELHVFYGPDGVGKTSLVAYLLALVTLQGRDVLVFINEDAPRDFLIKCWYAGADLNRLHIFDAGRSMREFLLPKCKVDLEAILRSRAWGCVYFDSINDIKNTDSRLNAADEARQLYGPLQTLAQAYDTAILCTAHTNARDVLEGARQIRAKARAVARVERPNFQPETHADGTMSFGLMQYDPLWSSLVVTEKFSRGKPGSVYAFQFEERVSCNPYTNAPDYELQPDGAKTNKMQYVCYKHELIPEHAHKIVPKPRESPADLEARVYDLVRNCPGFTANDIVRQIGGDRTKVLALVRKAKEDMGLK